MKKTNKPLFIMIFIITGMVMMFGQDSFSFDIRTIPNPREQNGWVVNIGGYLTSSEIEQINSKLSQLEVKTTVEIAVVVIPDSGGDIFSASQSLFDYWQIGKKGLDNGVLIMAAINERNFRTHTGYGVEHVITDFMARTLQDKYIVPRFKKEQYGRGIIEYLEQLEILIINADNPEYMEEIQKKYQEEKEKKEQRHRAVGQLKEAAVFIAIGLILTLIGLIIMIKDFLKMLNNWKKSYNRYTLIKKLESKGLDQGSTGLRLVIFVIGGFFIFICALLIDSVSPVVSGILIGIPVLLFVSNIVMGITAAIKKKTIIKIWRTAPRKCPECSGTMRKLSEKDDDQFLKNIQKIEEKIHTIDYDVWVCDGCGVKTIEKFRGWRYSFFVECPSCKSIAARRTGSKVTSYPTYTSTGTRRLTFKCKACDHKFYKYVTISKLTRSSSSSSGSSGSSFGGSSGGGESSFGGGSFGGGSSGGGGATSSW